MTTKLPLPRLIVSLLLLAVGAAKADVPPVQRAEVEHLLLYVKNSSCMMIRNGQQHDAAAALSHIQNKYEYFRAKIKSTEEFIELSASKSTMSGKYYTVKCGNQPPVKTQDWLMNELARYRKVL